MVSASSPYFFKIHYLSGGAIMVNNNGVETLYYGYTDHQGSLIALTDASGNVVEKYAYDPWGARRNPADWTQKDNRTSWITNRGYTGHEHIDAFGIINMNGRVYDPATAMFMNTDPLIQSPDNWVNYNRYSYCFNNPLIYSDPSGYANTASSEFAGVEERFWQFMADGSTYNQAFSATSGGRRGGGGGGGGGIPTPLGHSSDIWDEVDELRKTDHGGFTNGLYTMYFKSYDEEYFVGSIYKQRFGSSFDKNLGKNGHLKEGSKIENYNGIKGLTLISYVGDDDGNGLLIDLSYTGPEAKGAYWAQYITTNYPLPARFGNYNGVLSYWDDWETGNGRYYTDEQMRRRTIGSTVSFHDDPHRDHADIPWFFSARLYLFNSQNELILKIYYGFSVNNNNVTANPITAITP